MEAALLNKLKKQLKEMATSFKMYHFKSYCHFNDTKYTLI